MYIVQWKFDGSYLKSIGQNSANWSNDKNQAAIFRSPDEFKSYVNINPNCGDFWIGQCDIIAIPAVPASSIKSEKEDKDDIANNDNVYVVRLKYNMNMFITNIVPSWITWGPLNTAITFSSEDAAKEYVVNNYKSTFDRIETISEWYNSSCIVQEMHPLNLKK